MLRTLILGFSLTLSTSIFSQGIIDGFMKGKGHTDISLSYSYENFNKYWGAEEISITRDIQSASLYVAHGITDWADVILSAPYINNTGVSGFQDGVAMIRLKVAEIQTEKINFGILAGTGYSLPLTDYETESAFAIGQHAEAIPARLIFSAQHQNGWFLQLQSGYTWRIDPTPPSFPMIAKIGYASAKNYFDIWFHRQQAEGGFDYRDGFDQPFRSFGVSFSKIGATYYRPINPWIGGFFQAAYTLDGRNVGQAIRASIGFTLRLDGFKLAE
ncbi:hypothetical protein [Halocola ammonii]